MVKNSFMSRTMASLSNESIVSPYIEEYLLKADFPAEYNLKIENRPHRWNDRFHPSSDIATPEMVLYYQKHPKYGPNLKKDPFGSSSLIAMQLGTAIHAMFEAILVDIGLTTKEECEVYFKEDRLGISGMCDVRSLILPDGRKVLVDLKTCSKIPTKLDPLHSLQVQLYMDLVENAPRELGTVLYIEKSYPHTLRDFPVKKDPQALKDLYTKWTRVREAIKANDPSGLEFCCNGTGTRYSSCPVKDHCQILKKINP